MSTRKRKNTPILDPSELHSQKAGKQPTKAEIEFTDESEPKDKQPKPKRAKRIHITVEPSIYGEIMDFLKKNPVHGKFSHFVASAAYEKMKRLESDEA